MRDALTKRKVMFLVVCPVLLLSSCQHEASEVSEGRDQRQEKSDTSEVQKGINELVVACADGDIRRARELIDAGVDPNGCGQWANSGDDAAALYLDHHVVNGQTPLVSAVYGNRIETLTFLLDSGASINQADCNGDLATHAAAALPSVDCMTILIERGADLDVGAESDGDTPFMIAAKFRSPSFDLLLPRVSPVEPLTPDGVTALMVAANYGESQAVLDLLKRGADPNASTDQGLTPLIAAASGEFDETVLRALCEAGADLEAKVSPDGFTALMVAYHKVTEARDKIAVLLDCGADPNVRDRRGRT